MTFNRVVLSSDTNPKFLDFWPLVAKGWRTFFKGVEVWLAVVGEAKDLDLAELARHGNVVRYQPVPGVPISNQAKLARYHLAATWCDDSVVMTNDIDLLPLQTEYWSSLVKTRKTGHLLAMGAELYTGDESGKFTAGYLTAESYLWMRLVNPLCNEWLDFVKGFSGLRVIDHKEDVLRNVQHEDPNAFSDESLLRALLHLNPVPVTHVRRGYYPYTQRALCRSDWMFEPHKLADGTYVEAHLLRPWSQHREKIKPLEDHLNTVLSTS